MSILNLGKVRPVLLGTYSEATEYKFLNGVSYNGSYYFYINETASTGNLPTDTEYWAIAAQKGDKGDLGASIVTAAFVDDAMVFTLDDDTTVTLVGAKTVLKGDKGETGTIYTPAISEDGVLSFTNNGELDNPTPVDLTGPQGDPAPNTIYQYSVNNIDWTDAATGAQWYRQSGDNGTTWSEAIAIGTTAYADGKITQTITENVTDKAPSEGAVFDALALKAPLSSPTFTGDVIVPDQSAGNNSTKAANTKYVDAGLGLKANTTDVVDALALKADITLLNQEKQLLTQEIDSLKRSAIENSNAPYLTVSGYGDVTLAKNSVGVGTVGVDGVTVKNELVNGAFSSGLTGWSTSSASISVLNRVLSITSTGEAPAASASRSYTMGLNTKVYVRGRARVTNLSAIELRIRFISGLKELIVANPIENQWYEYTAIYNNTTYSTELVNYVRHSYTTKEIALGKVAECEGMMILNLTALGLDALTVAQVGALVAAGYFNGKKTFGGVGCLVSKDSAEAETGRMYFATTPMYSNATLKDILTYSEGKYYNTHNVDSDGVAIATPYDTEVSTNGQIVCLSEGTVTYEPWFPDIGIYTDKFTLTKAITAVKELYKYGSETPITDAVIAVDGLSFTSASLTAGDLAYGVFEFDEPLRPLMTIKSRNDDATVVDTATGKIYTFRPVVKNGAIASWTLTEV